jgi:proteic killer suppression protein
LRRFYERNDATGLRTDWADKVRRRLDALAEAEVARDLDLPGFGFHALSGDRRGRFALTVSRNWRLTFGFADGDAIDVDLEDYHG